MIAFGLTLTLVVAVYVGRMSGTDLDYLVVGDGPVTVIVHGVQSVAAHWTEVAERLPGRTVVPNRRGRAGSAPLGADYDLGVEVADLHRVLDGVGPGAVLVGHSYGGAIALLTAAERGDLSALVLYEPALPVGRPVTGPALDRMRAALREGDRSTALTIVATEVVGDAVEDVEAIRVGDPAGWGAMLELIATTYVELSALDRLAYDPTVLSKVSAPTTVLIGERTDREPMTFGRSARAVVAGVAGARLVLLPEQGHISHVTAPDLLAAEIRAARRVGD